MIFRAWSSWPVVTQVSAQQARSGITFASIPAAANSASAARPVAEAKWSVKVSAQIQTSGRARAGADPGRLRERAQRRGLNSGRLRRGSIPAAFLASRPAAGCAASGWPARGGVIAAHFGSRPSA